MNVVEKIKEQIERKIAIGKELGAVGSYIAGLTDALRVVNQVEKDYNNGWIPCSERLPKDREYVLVCATGQDEGVFISYYEEETNRWRYDTEEQPYYVSVIAWQPLPPAYKESEEPTSKRLELMRECGEEVE